MSLGAKTIAMISVGASVAANCHPCLEYHTARAREAGLTDQEIKAAAEIGKAVKEGAGKSMEKLIAKLLAEKPAPAQPGCGSGCGCGQ
jgi:AhpD family alkylhydroperoxidase